MCWLQECLSILEIRASCSSVVSASMLVRRCSSVSEQMPESSGVPLFWVHSDSGSSLSVHAGYLKYPPAVACPEREGTSSKAPYMEKRSLWAAARSDDGVEMMALATGAVERAHRAAAEQPGVPVRSCSQQSGRRGASGLMTLSRGAPDDAGWDPCI